MGFWGVTVGDIQWMQRRGDGDRHGGPLDYVSNIPPTSSPFLGSGLGGPARCQHADTRPIQAMSPNINLSSDPLLKDASLDRGRPPALSARPSIALILHIPHRTRGSGNPRIVSCLASLGQVIIQVTGVPLGLWEMRIRNVGRTAGGRRGFNFEMCGAVSDDIIVTQSSLWYIVILRRRRKWVQEHKMPEGPVHRAVALPHGATVVSPADLISAKDKWELQCSPQGQTPRSIRIFSRVGVERL
ncbi:hypothetical protein SODALDRAFT_357309 [Sodiomyces alkalinus F11]|uniref:Uncharacterized protein n=1 Tax=Sodiomyces alkalinus (strain CBS 110278 / VKM F-3762 / F11) TaxID=1314773 RepID=A0A3N2Q3S0_SODAK|nr:hypothetical protein SODALDRAFT_357309 [Sodiomyces alkalinus F11]ROT41275.1 hypothetical protein SODALDRAFT_357309 [Sodiomyces alkalinus F11]